LAGTSTPGCLSWGEEILCCHVETEEVPRGAARAWRQAGAESGRPIAHVADDLGIHKETLRKRVRQAEADQGLRPDLPTSEEREEIKRLRQENFELRRANEILKSASVFFAKQLDPDRPR
jgi:transposase